MRIDGTGRVQGGKGMEASGSGRDSREIQEGCDKTLGPISQKPQELIRPTKPFVVNLYLKTEKCIHLKHLE